MPGTGKQQYKGHPDLEAFQGFYELCQHPLYYNGGIESLSDIRQILIRFPLLKGVFIGRGLLSSPLLAKEFKGNETFCPNNVCQYILPSMKSFFSLFPGTSRRNSIAGEDEDLVGIFFA